MIFRLMKMWLILLTTVIFASANKSSGNNVTPGTTIIPPSTDVPVSEMPPSGLPGLLYPRESESREVSLCLRFYVINKILLFFFVRL